MKTEDLSFELPTELLAKNAAEPRDHARLLVYDRKTRTCQHHQVKDLPSLELLQPGDLLIANRTKVLPARFFCSRHHTGGRCEGLYVESPEADLWHMYLKSKGKPKEGERLDLDDDAYLTLEEKRGGGLWHARLHSNGGDTLDVLQRIGSTPLPPYILAARKQDGSSDSTPEDAERYNTVFAREQGSVAAPTAGLHFTPDLLAKLETSGIRFAQVVLHVGPGTFAPVTAENLSDHHMHMERYTVPADTLQAIRDTRAAGRRIWLVGTTTLRALESLPLDWECMTGDYEGATNLFVRPGPNGPLGLEAGEFRFTDGLMTNFHLPKSTLLALVAALPDVGLDTLKDVYTEAIREKYRFYSYGDAMLIV